MRSHDAAQTAARIEGLTPSGERALSTVRESIEANGSRVNPESVQVRTRKAGHLQAHQRNVVYEQLPLSGDEARRLRKILGKTDGAIKSTDFMQRALLQAFTDHKEIERTKLDWITLCGYLNDFDDDNRERCRKHFEC